MTSSSRPFPRLRPGRAVVAGLVPPWASSFALVLLRYQGQRGRPPETGGARPGLRETGVPSGTDQLMTSLRLK
jgi:hypothetical protein